MKLPQHLLGLLLAMPLFACSQAQVPEAPTPSPEKVTAYAPSQDDASKALPIGDSSRTSLDWPGSYEGVLPCASCEGIKTHLELNNDGTYLLQTHFLGLKEGEKESERFEERGTFIWNASGGAIQLESGAGYQVGENQLFMLDREGNRITGTLSEHYRLKKTE
ncbi:copper resistance protein NlpE [Shewanella litorisediminis]|uniref:Copper resistance protein NlpE N-terminal domain-containing protein n=1 Tax=Shewanella litorisediminis TaxID=1173586 RepID=A0ABX7FZM4_9GAMM|nr:copper resistance protein NlpE [Shewanella litorisediminis]MCL2919619.1 copper resistance protein NlpE [Shewanella litorisediminis]QRH00511.1 copper resistance protein NlpE N-terminal domain-containing protein [Shewanella litorisediminis]